MVEELSELVERLAHFAAGHFAINDGVVVKCFRLSAILSVSIGPAVFSMCFLWSGITVLPVGICECLVLLPAWLKRSVKKQGHHQVVQQHSV
jgi:hypothetical protein